MTEAEGGAAIADSDWLLRRVPDQPEKMWTRKGGRLRPSSAALKPSDLDGGLSVDVRRLLVDPGTPTSVLSEATGDGLVEWTASQPRSLGLDVRHDPLPARYSHANVIGFDAFEKAEAKRLQRELAKLAVWVQEPASAAETA